ncbi:MAG TPA: NADH-quinone oxidoreductase subunit NuoG [Capillimicrobium sp.]|nr:NADH-quinone oxidoreductase subunit NuoG [Capillimicrobium sp.]
MPRPEINMITFSIDGREVQAPENMMLVDAAKYGDVEIPVFCYEPKLGQPVGACRMCLVEIEGIPKLQTGCSTPVKDGMVVHTQTQRVHEAQEAVVEFLLINHPLDCPVCDKGGECPLQDISFGWGGGRSRFIEPKRHFQKPLELSPLIAIDRERCILCYRCVRYSQEISEDYQLVLQERGAASYVATFDGHPYVAPFSGNIIELCPVGALTSKPYRFRARPWDIEGAGSVCTMCPGQCNVTFTVRDDRVLRVLARDNKEVDDGWLCDRGRFAYQAIHVDERITRPMVRDGGELRPVSWERALEEAARGLGRARDGQAAALAGGGTTNEEGFLLQRIVREALGSPHLDSQRAPVSREALQAISDPGLQAEVADLEFAHAVLVLDTEPVDDMAILDLRIRKGVRRNRVKLAIASARPSSLDPNAALSVRFAPGGSRAFAAELVAAARGEQAGEDARAVVELLRGAGEDIVILASERVGAALAMLADELGLRDRAGAGLLVVPSSANGRGLREVGVLPDAGPGLRPVAEAGRDAAGIARGLADGELTALWLMGVDPLRDLPNRPAWERALDRASTVVAHASFLTEGIREHATVVFPAEAYAEKDGTLTHPDGRLQRVRPAIGHQGESRFTWQVLNDLGRRLGIELRVLTAGMALAQLAEAVPFYAGLTQDEIGGRGVRWQTRDAAAAFPRPSGAIPVPVPRVSETLAAEAAEGLRLGTFRSIWASPEVEHSPALKFLTPKQKVEMSPADADRLGLRDGQAVQVAQNGHAVSATVALRHAIPAGSVFLQDGLEEDSANEIAGSIVEVRA